MTLLGKVGISQSDAKRLMAVAGNTAISNRPNLGDFPSSPTSLYELSRLQPEQIEQAIESGQIRPVAPTVLGQSSPAPPVAQPFDADSNFFDSIFSHFRWR